MTCVLLGVSFAPRSLFRCNQPNQLRRTITIFNAHSVFRHVDRAHTTTTCEAQTIQEPFHPLFV